MAATKKDRKPKGPRCPKCGAEKGWSGPHYQKGKRVEVKHPVKPHLFTTSVVETVESLVFTCNQCGYDRHEACITN